MKKVDKEKQAAPKKPEMVFVQDRSDPLGHYEPMRKTKKERT